MPVTRTKGGEFSSFSVIWILLAGEIRNDCEVSLGLHNNEQQSCYFFFTVTCNIVIHNIFYSIQYMYIVVGSFSPINETIAS